MKKIERVFVNLPHLNWYELSSSDYIFKMKFNDWKLTNPQITDIIAATFIPVVHEGIEYMIHISNFIFS